MLRYAATIFLSAFLLFLVQPLIGKYILPWFGGTPGVWTTCMLFFQLVLLGGYAYAHWLTSKCSTRNQAIVHLVLLFASLALLPIVPNEVWKPTPDASPSLRILVLLAVTLGLPYFVLSSTGPLLQSWFSRTNPGLSPWRLYALSNVGSLLALLAYPFVFEPVVGRWTQAVSWSVAYGAFVLLCALVAWLARTAGVVANSPASATKGVDYNRRENDGFDRFLWLALPMCASVLLLAITSHLCQDVAVIPFLWILPLAIYLISFIIAFDADRWYLRRVFVPLFVVCFALVGLTMFSTTTHMNKAFELRKLLASTYWQIGLNSVLLFTCCMICHGELFRLRPPPRLLTRYYLTISAGGALGGVFVALLAPILFDTFAERWFGLGGVIALSAACLVRDPVSAFYRGKWPIGWGSALVVLAAATYAVFASIEGVERHTIFRSRNFYGTISIYEDAPEDKARHNKQMRHGPIIHGSQLVTSAFSTPGSPPLDLSRFPTTYYGVMTGVHRALFTIRQRDPQSPLNVGVVGLGVGTMAATALPGDRFTMYDINPDVIQLARNQFTYVANCRGDLEIVEGDARLSLENEANQGNLREFDLLVLDAFSSDAIPLHLLTKEAFDTYVKHLANDGIIAIHVTNDHIDLRGPLWRMGEEFGFSVLLIGNGPYHATMRLPDRAGSASDWILMSRDPKFFDHPNFDEILRTPDGKSQKVIVRIGNDDRRSLNDTLLWTDDHTDLLNWLKRPRTNP